jgi:Na+:H+ antiporter, NhaA family
MKNMKNRVTEETPWDHTADQWFFNIEAFGGILLMVASVSALIIANSVFAKAYEHWLHLNISLSIGSYAVSHSVLHWVNDGLMALFFFTVGLEIKREILVGELSSLKMALLPVIAAVGGMFFPGVIYVMFNYGKPGLTGWGIPVATDIAFALGAIAVLGRRLPIGLRVFLTAFAIADDLGAVMIIAFFYTKTIVTPYLFGGVVCVLIMLVGNLLWVRWLPFYIVLGIGTWIFIMGSGVHATIAGVVVAMLIPARGKYDMIRFVKRVRRIVDNISTHRYTDGYWYSIFLKPEHLKAVHAIELSCYQAATPLQRLEHALHPWAVFLILPLFAFFNAGLSFGQMPLAGAVTNPITLGCALGLFVGKPLGVGIASYFAVRSGLAVLPDQVRWPHIIGAGMLGGIGFTMSLFVSGLSFADAQFLNYSKFGILSGSILSAICGLIILSIFGRHLDG